MLLNAFETKGLRTKQRRAITESLAMCGYYTFLLANICIVCRVWVILLPLVSLKSRVVGLDSPP